MAGDPESCQENIEPHPAEPTFDDLVEDVRRQDAEAPIAFWCEAGSGELLFVDGRSAWPPDVAMARIGKADRDEASQHNLQFAAGKG